MNIILETGFSEISFDIEFDQPAITKGKALVASNHVQRVREHVVGDESMIEGFVIRQTSVTSQPYSVQLEVSKIGLLKQFF